MIRSVIVMASFDANISDLTLLHSVRRTVTTLINFLSSILVLANLGWHMAAQIVRLLLFHFNQILADLDRLAEPGRGAGSPAGPPPGPPPGPSPSAGTGSSNLIDLGVIGLQRNGPGYSRLGRV